MLTVIAVSVFKTRVPVRIIRIKVYMFAPSEGKSCFCAVKQRFHLFIFNASHIFHQNTNLPVISAKVCVCVGAGPTHSWLTWLICCNGSSAFINTLAHGWVDGEVGQWIFNISQIYINMNRLAVLLFRVFSAVQMITKTFGDSCQTKHREVVVEFRAAGMEKIKFSRSVKYHFQLL